MTDPRVVVVDGSNLATEGRTTPSLQQLDEAVRAYAAEDPDAEIVVVVDASFEHRVDESERAALEEAELHGEVVSPPAGAIGRGDAFVLRIAERTGAVVLSNDSFQEFHGEHPWLFDEGRLIGGKPVPGVGWIFTPRIPVRGPKSRQATSRARRAAAAEPLSPPAKAAELARAARKAAAKRMAVMPDGSPPKVGDVWQQPGPGEAPPGGPAAGAREGGVAALAGEEPLPAEAPPAKKAARKRGAAKKAAGKKAAAAAPLAEEPGAEQRAAEEVAAEQAAAETGAKKGVATKAGAKKEPGKKAAAKKGAGKKAAAKKAAGAKAAAEAAEGPEAPETAPGELRVAEEVPPTRAAKKAAGKKAPAKAAPIEKEAAKKGPVKAAVEKAPAKKAAAKKAAAKKAAPAKVAAEKAAAGRAPAVERAAAEAPEEEAALGTSRHGTHPSRPREDPALREAIDEATAEAWQPPTEEEEEVVVAAGGGDGTGGATAPGEGRDGRGPRRRRRRATGSAPAVNEPLAFITFVAAHPIGSEVEGEVVSFTSHGAMVDVDLADGGRLHCYIPLTAMAEPPPTKARQVLSRGERRPFVLVGLDPPRRVAELAVPGVASVAPEPAGNRR